MRSALRSSIPEVECAPCRAHARRVRAQASIHATTRRRWLADAVDERQRFLELSAHAAENEQMTSLGRLWAGKLPLDDAFWTFAVLYGLALNLVTSVLFLALVSADRPVAALILGYGVPLPYNLVVLVGVWRAAAREGPSRRADVYRIVTLVGMILLSVT